jgi:hypothetical protein
LGREGGWEKKIQRQGANGNKQRNEEEEWSCIGSRGETVIDYGIVNEEAWEKVEEFRIGERGSEGEGKNREEKGWGIRITYTIFSSNLHNILCI